MPDARPGATVVIPARGGSKGIPRKNLRSVGGVPLVVRAIRAARGAALVDRVFVSTDDADIATAARDAGAEVIERPDALGHDHATSESALLHALDSLRERGEPEPEITVFVQCTSPFVEPSDIDGAIAPVASGVADCVFTAAPTHAFLWRASEHGAVGVNHDHAARLRRQDREPEYVEAGSVYAMRTQGFREAGHRFFGRIALHEIPAERALEIDEPIDLVIAESLETVLAASPHAPTSGRTDDFPGHRLPDQIDALVFDFDGVLTDNRVITLQDGTEAVIADRSDGLGIERLRDAGVRMLVLSKERNPVVAARCAKLRLDCLQGVDEKGPALVRWIDDQGMDARHVVFVGNDVNDLDCLRLAGCGVVVGDAHPDAVSIADVVLTRSGGRGAVRELSDLVLAHLDLAP